MIGVVSTSGCIESTTQYELGEEVEVTEGSITLVDIRAVQTLYTQPVDTPTNIQAREDLQFIVFVFDTANLSIEQSREYDYLKDSIQLKLSEDTVAPPVDIPPKKENNKTNRIGVAFRVAKPFNVEGSEVIFYDDENFVWPASRIYLENTREYLQNPPEFSVESVEIPEVTDSDTFTVTISVVNKGGSTGKFKSILRASETKNLSSVIEPNESTELSGEITVEDDSQSVLVSWGTDQRTTNVKKE